MRNPALAIARAKEYRPTPRLVKINPTLAEQILNNNRMNRPLRQGRVEQYARDMREGRWQLNGDTVKMTVDGDLLDGQHRLFAVIEANATIEMLIVEGLDPDVMPTIDTGAARSFADVLSIDGAKNASVTAAVLRWLAWYDMKQNRPVSGPSALKITHSELYALAPKHPDLAARVSEAAATKKARQLLTASILAFVYTLAYRLDPAKAGAWLRLLESGMAGEERHPVYQLRERMVGNKLSAAKLPFVDIAALAIKSWNQFASGKRTKTLRWTSAEAFPVATL